MLIQATISCQCSCIFEAEFQASTENNAPKCPQCGNVMSYDSWKHLRSIMADLNDFNTDIVRWHSDRGEPLMQVPAITLRTLKAN